MCQLKLNNTGNSWLGEKGSVIDAIQLTPQGVNALVRALARVSTSSKKKKTSDVAVSHASRYARLSHLRCYMGGAQAPDTNANATTDTEAPAGPTTTTTLRGTAGATATKLLDQMATDFAADFNSDEAVTDNGATNAGIDAVQNFMAKLRGDGLPGLPEFAVDADQAVGSDCRVKLCLGSCDAGKVHTAFAVAGATELRPGCGHNSDHGLCAQCQPFQDDATLNVCAHCATPCRNPRHDALTMVSVTSAVAETTAKSPPVGYIKLCYLDRAEGNIYTLKADAVDGPTRLGPSEVDMLAKASSSPGGAKAPQTGDRYLLLEKFPVLRKQLCGPCLCVTVVAPNSSLVCTDAEASASDDVKYMPSHRDIIGLVAAQAAATSAAERQQLRERCKKALEEDSALIMKAEKTFLGRISSMIENSSSTK
jgi:hypothetical protein